MPTHDSPMVSSGEKPAVSASAFPVTRWGQKVVRWFRVKRLEYQWWSSRKFQRECEKIRCFTLARLEAEHRARLEARLREERARL